MLQIPSFDDAHLLVVGDVMLDRYWYGSTDRISPEAPVPVINISQRDEKPGGAANVAVNIKALGSHCELLGVCGADDEAFTLEAKLAALGIKTSLQQYKNIPTVTKLRIISRNQQLIRLDFEKTFPQFETKDLLLDFENKIQQAKVIVFSDYGKGTLQNIQEFIKLARKNNCFTLVDPKGSDFSRYHGANILTPNRKEFEKVVGHCKTEAEFIERGNLLIKQHQFDGILITRGEQGMTLIHREHKVTHLPARAREVFDVTGAGDTVIGVLAAALAAGCDIKDAMALANVAAGQVVAKMGAASITALELRQAIYQMHDQYTGVLNEEQLLQAVQWAKAHNKRIVMTNGCFDILHAGHVNYLQEAKALGDRLIVAVNDDVSVKNLKGEGRPINSLARRMAVLAALESVDWVLPFSEQTPERLITSVLPDVLVKGGDYTVEQIAGSRQVLANGGKVEILSFEEGCSTTGVLEKILETES